MDIQLINQLSSVGTQTNASTGALTKSPVADTAKPSAPVVDVPPSAVQAVDSSQLKQALNNVNAFVQKISPELTFSLDEGTGIRVVKLVDQSTKEVIRQIPSEEMLSIASGLDKLQGLLIKHKV